jgi:hypothetical protein
MQGVIALLLVAAVLPVDMSGAPAPPCSDGVSVDKHPGSEA